MGAQNVQICASNALIGMEPIPAQIGGAARSPSRRLGRIW
jgi:hypothetical protein